MCSIQHWHEFNYTQLRADALVDGDTNADAHANGYGHKHGYGHPDAVTDGHADGHTDGHRCARIWTMSHGRPFSRLPSPFYCRHSDVHAVPDGNRDR